MRPLLAIILGTAATWAQNAPPPQAPVAQVVQNALPPGTSVPQDGSLGGFLRGLPPDQRQSALTALTSSPDAVPEDPASQAALASAYMDLGDPAHALSAANAALAADPQNGDALAAKARALRSSNDVQGALAAYRAIPPSSPQYAVAVSQIKLLGKGGTGGGVSPAAFSSGSADAGDIGGLAPHTAQHLVNAFNRGMQGSTTFGDTVRRFDPNSVTLGDLQRAGIGIQVGPPDMKTPVQVVQGDNGQQIIQFSPSAIDNSHLSRVAAQLGRGIEEARTNRGDNWLTAWIRDLGGRVVAVKVNKDLAPGDSEPKPSNVSDQELMRDVRMSQRPSRVPASENYNNNLSPNGQMTNTYMALTSNAPSVGPDTVDLLVRLTRCLYGPQATQTTAQDNAYLTDLKNRGL